jgi:hypothetical protein
MVFLALMPLWVLTALIRSTDDAGPLSRRCPRRRGRVPRPECLLVAGAPATAALTSDTKEPQVGDLGLSWWAILGSNQ